MPSDALARYQSIKKELEEVRRAFLDLLNAIPDGDLERALPGEGWTAKQEMVHIAQVLNVIPAGILQAHLGHRRSVLSFIPTFLRSWVNGHIIIPVISRQATRASVAESYGKAHAALIDLLEKLPEEAWNKGAHYPSQYRTVEQMAHRPAEHFKMHADHLRRVLGVM
jgi:hypothetical protein